MIPGVAVPRHDPLAAPPPPMAFDPCREWLGIDAVDLGDPRRFLGLGSAALGREEVVAAAEARLAILARISPGPFAKAHAALVARVTEARDLLLAEAEPDLPPAEWHDPAPDHAAADASAAAVLDEWQSSTGSDEADHGIRDARRSPIPTSHRRAAPGGPLVGMLALLAAAAAALAFFVLRPDETTPRQVRRVVLVQDRPNPLRRTEPTRPDVSETAIDRPAVLAAPPKPPAEPTAAAEPPAPMPDAEARDDGEQLASPTAAEREARLAAEARVEEKSRRERQRAAEERQRAEAERARTATAIDTAIGQAYDALRRDELDTADRALAAAARHVGDDVAAATRVERWTLLAAYARDFVTYRDEAFAAANAGREYDLDGQRFSVIEINPRMFIYKRAGRIERVPRESVSPGIEMAVVRTWFSRDGRAANHLFLGARWLCVEPPDPRRAEAEWKTAAAGGEEAGPLLALLDDPVLRRAKR